MRWLVLFGLVLLGSGKSDAYRASERRQDKSKAFSYILPDGWSVKASDQFEHDVIMLPSDDGFNRNIVINDQPGSSSLEILKRKYERDLARALKDFRLISSELIELGGTRQAVRIVHTNTMPGVPVRQVNYIIYVAGKRYFIACTTPKDDGEKHDEAFEAFVTSMSKSEE
jgi:hypothetical protein